ncbi:MAG: hypothetical protein QOJ16_4636, partial [Acidobacteriota bacterium]|nr:hypothetical protein [Acidobacteriota bacterium]
MAFLALYERKQQQPLRWSVVRWVFLSALFPACFLAWNDQRQLAATAKES